MYICRCTHTLTDKLTHTYSVYLTLVKYPFQIYTVNYDNFVIVVDMDVLEHTEFTQASHNDLTEKMQLKTKIISMEKKNIDI